MAPQKPTVNTRVDQLVAGDVTLDEVAAEMPRRDRSIPKVTPKQLVRGDRGALPRANYWEVVAVPQH